MKMEVLKIGRYIKYYDPKETKEQIGLVISFDENMMVVWNQESRCPYGLPRSCQLHEPEAALRISGMPQGPGLIVTVRADLFDESMLEQDDKGKPRGLWWQKIDAENNRITLAFGPGR